MMILFCCFACYSVRALRWVLGGAATSCGLWRFFRPTFAEHDMLFSILLSSNALYVFSINQPQHTCGQKTPTLEQISVVYHIIFSKTSASLRGALSLHPVQCINIKPNIMSKHNVIYVDTVRLCTLLALPILDSHVR